MYDNFDCSIPPIKLDLCRRMPSQTLRLRLADHDCSETVLTEFCSQFERKETVRVKKI